MRNNSPAWPFLSVLACLFVLCVTTPRAWERIGRQGSLSKRLSALRRDHHATVPAKAVEPVADAPADETAPDSQSVTIAPPAAEGFVERAIPVMALGDQDPLLLDGDANNTEPPPALERPRVAAVVNAFDAKRFVAGSGYVILEAAPAFGRQVSDSLYDLARRPLPPALEQALLPAPAPTKLDAAASAIIAEQQAIVPATLFEQLKSLEQQPLAREWAKSVQNGLRGLSTGGSAEHAAVFGELESLISDASRLAADADSDVLQAQILRASHSVERRMPLWRRVVEQADATSDEQPLPVVVGADREMARALAQLQTFNITRHDGVAWRDYLELDRVGRAARDSQPRATRERLARRVLDRLTRARQTPEQRSQLADARLSGLTAGLRQWAATPLGPRQLLAELETFERLGRTSEAKTLSASFRNLANSPNEADRRLGAELSEHYSNANFRMVLSRELVNRLLPRPEAMRLPINETLAGTPIHGEGVAWTELRVVFIPDGQRVRLGLEGNGSMQSDTLSASGPAKFRNHATATYNVQKLFVLGPKGLREWPAIARAHNQPASLSALETDYDRIPLVNSLVRNIARSKHQDAAEVAVSEADIKLANRVRDQFDREAGARLIQAQSQYTARLAGPFERLGVDVTPVSFATTEDRVTMRYRLASAEQLGAHTPRPRAPSDSMLSMQVHESAINNMLARLELDGRRFTLPELYKTLSEKLNRPELKMPDDLREELVVTFAAEDPIHVQFKPDRLELRLSLAELTVGQNRWRDFTVRARYTLRVDGLDAALQRESGIFLEGPAMRGKPELVLRGVFARALSQSRRIPLSFEKLAQDPRLKDLMISQAIIDDGWLGLAYGPNRLDREARRAAPTVERR